MKNYLSQTMFKSAGRQQQFDHLINDILMKQIVSEPKERWIPLLYGAVASLATEVEEQQRNMYASKFFRAKSRFAKILRQFLQQSEITPEAQKQYQDLFKAWQAEQTALRFSRSG